MLPASGVAEKSRAAFRLSQTAPTFTLGHVRLGSFQTFGEPDPASALPGVVSCAALNLEVYHTVIGNNALCIAADLEANVSVGSKDGHSRRVARCPLYPRKRTWISTVVMSAKGHEQTLPAIQ